MSFQWPEDVLRYVILSIHVMFEDNQNRLKRRFLVAKLYYGSTDAREIRLQTEYLTPCVVTCHKRSQSLVVWLRETTPTISRMLLWMGVQKGHQILGLMYDLLVHSFGPAGLAWSSITVYKGSRSSRNAVC